MNRRIIDINAPTLTHISMDIKHMPPSKDKFYYISVMLCETSNFMVAAPMKTTTAPEICNTIMDHFMGYFGTTTRIVCDQGPSIYVTPMSMDFTLIWYICHHSQPHKSPVPYG